MSLSGPYLSFYDAIKAFIPQTRLLPTHYTPLPTEQMPPFID